jgi:CheY-like chemotaxis protein
MSIRTIRFTTVLDINMPRMGGRETLERLRGMDSELPVLMSSGFIEAHA